ASLIGAAGGVIVVFSIIFLDKLRIDDPVGAISVHGVVGFFGLMVVPLTNDDASFAAQAFGALVIFTWVFGASLLAWLVIKMLVGLRISEEEEYEGADVSECGMEAYPEFTR
ncbi:MAG: ammonium transporter, partial [Thiolinea sp.]